MNVNQNLTSITFPIKNDPCEIEILLKYLISVNDGS